MEDCTIAFQPPQKRHSRHGGVACCDGEGRSCEDDQQSHRRHCMLGPTAERSTYILLKPPREVLGILNKQFGSNDLWDDPVDISGGVGGNLSQYCALLNNVESPVLNRHKTNRPKSSIQKE